jgi:hypothetical protein
MRVLQRKYDGRLSLKMEIPKPEMHGLTALERRMQTRRSFFVEKFLRVDLSIVQCQNLQHLITSPPVVKYEVELELVDDPSLSEEQITAQLWNWIVQILDVVGKPLAHPDDPALLFLRPNPNPNTSDLTSASKKMIATDVLLVPTQRSVSRPPNHTNHTNHTTHTGH